MFLSSHADHTVPQPRNLWPLIALLGLAAICSIVLWIGRLPKPNQNVPAIGKAGKVEAVDIAIQPPAELDFLSKAEVLRWRTEAIQQHPELLAHAYVPAEAVFGQIVDGLPWWGMEGQFYYGKGDRSIEGLSEESRFLLNPYLLVAAAFSNRWQGRITEAELSTFPLTCMPRDLRWWPRQARAEVTYDAGCVAKGQNFTFDLIAYNARDLNLNYIFVSYKDSHNVSKPDIPAVPCANPQFIHRGSSCGYPGGCNNMSPATPDLDGLEIKGLPAQAVIWLWKENPASLEQTPDMIFSIQFR